MSTEDGISCIATIAGPDLKDIPGGGPIPRGYVICEKVSAHIKYIER